MSKHSIRELQDCTDLAQVLQARRPAIVHGTLLLAMTLLLAAICWAALARANLVVRAPGRVRPAEATSHVFSGASPKFDGRVTHVGFREGDQVESGDLLLRFDTERLDNEIATARRRIATAESEQAELRRRDRLISKEFAAATSKARAELMQAERQIETARQQRASRVREARAELAAATDQLERTQGLFDGHAVSQKQLLEVQTRGALAHEKLAQAELPLDDSRIGVQNLGVELIERQFEVRRAELAGQRIVRDGEIAAVRKQLELLMLAREQSVLRSPIDGVVISETIRVGDVLQPATAVVEIASDQSLCFVVAVPNRAVADLEPGMPVMIKFDAFDYQEFGTVPGAIGFIAPDSRVSQSAGGPAASYEVRVLLKDQWVGRGETRGRVKLGMVGAAEIVTEQRSLLSMLLQKIRGTISLS